MKVKEFAEMLQEALIRNDHRTFRTKWGIVFAWGFWVGPYYSKANKRLCIGLGLISLWIAFPGGYVPIRKEKAEKTMQDLNNAVNKEQQKKGTIFIVTDDSIKNSMHRDMTSESPIEQRFPRLN